MAIFISEFPMEKWAIHMTRAVKVKPGTTLEVRFMTPWTRFEGSFKTIYIYIYIYSLLS